MSNRGVGDVIPTGPGLYRIIALGALASKWSDRLGGMQLSVREDGQHPHVELYGQLPDQAALLGVLNMLCDLQLTLISVLRLTAGDEHGSAEEWSA